jgi:hypothetical protein
MITELASIVKEGTTMYQVSKKIRTLFLCTLCAAIGCEAPVCAQECDQQSHQDPGLMAADAVIARPVGAVATVAGFAVFLVSSPFSALGGNTGEAWDSLVASPANYTFKRPLGHLDCDPAQNKIPEKHH